MIGRPGGGALSLVIITMNAPVAYQSVKHHHFREARRGTGTPCHYYFHPDVSLSLYVKVIAVLIRNNLFAKKNSNFKFSNFLLKLFA
jgi:hypothetical protein